MVGWTWTEEGTTNIRLEEGKFRSESGHETQVVGKVGRTIGMWWSLEKRVDMKEKER